MAALELWRHTFGLDPSTATPSAVRQAWRNKAASLHPDHGGGQEEFLRVKRIYEDLLEFVSQPVKCPTCGGNGRVSHRRGLIVEWGSCTHCTGSGKIQRLEIGIDL